MYGLEKKPKAPFEFDLEKELRTDPAKTKLILKMVEERVQEVKKHLREGTASEDFDNYGILLHGYAALQKVINRIERKK